MTRSHARTIALAALLLAALLGLVAVASRGALGIAAPAAPPRAAPGLPDGVLAYAYAAFVVAGAVALPLVAYVYAQGTPYSRARRRRAWLAPLALVALGGLGVLAASRWGADLRDALARLDAWTGADGRGRTGAAPRPPAPGWLPLLVVSAALAAALGAVAGRRAARRRGRRPSLAASLSGALDEGVDDLVAEAEPRRAVILAYARMERALEHAGCSRHEAEAPLEYLARVLRELDVAPGPAATLTALFERAKFGHHAIEPELRERALAALRDVRAGLRERA